MCFHKKISLAFYCFLLVGGAAAFAGGAGAPVREKPVLEWARLPSIPDKEGFAGSFAGVSGKALIVAGGANFPGKRPWEGGEKVWYDKVFVLEPGAKEWREEGRLPQANGYGLSLPWKDGFLVIGGGDARENFKTVWFVMRRAGEGVRFAAMPDLPRALAMPAGAVAKNYIYVVGGLETPSIGEAANVLYRLDMSNTAAGWEAMEPCPGGSRFLAAAGAIGETLYVFGGARPDGSQAKRAWLTDAWSFHPELGWRELAPLPRPVVAPPSPAVPVGQAHLFLLGGDDGAQAGLGTPSMHKGFPRSILAYHTITDTWTNVGEAPFSLVTTSQASWAGGFVVAGGERMPGVRSTEVWKATVIVTKAAFGWINYLALAAYLSGMVGIGWYCSRRNKNTDDYFKAGGRIPWWAAGMAIYATMLSSLTFMAIPAKAYATNWTYLWANIPILVIAPILVGIYLPFYRRLNVTSAYEYLEKRFSLPVRLYGSAAFILFQIGRQSIVLLLPSIALATVSDLNVTTCIVLMGVLCVIYTVLGGMEAVIWTDVAQTFVLLGAAVISILVIVFGTEGGLSGLWTTAVANDKLHMFNFTWSPTTAANAFWVIFIGNIFAQLVSYTSDQAVVQRYMTTDTEKKAASSIWFNAVLAMPSSILFFLIGTALFVFYKAHPEALDPSQATDSIFPAFIVQNLPVGVAGLVIAGIFAAAQSTVSGSLNSVVTAIMTDFYVRLGGKARDAAALRLARIMTACLGVFATGCAIILAKLNLASLWDAYSSLVGLAASGLAGLFALGIFTRRASGRSALIGAFASIIVLYYVQRHTNLHFFLYAATGMLTCFFVGWIASIMLPSRKNVEGLTFGTLKK
ncbi:SSS family solute:Na+ symporter [Ereboglobus sp. PH5-10]|uniref:sodium:solute symporter family transporter n=1 Tax=Ereboglobus sp. PH5-10 TaxID=2940629 RepID=UPI002405D59F|nr:sodium/solute symporter [Ereboglobus sp. PH5-10]MDF9828035.1 SSS family solute:Na+ symporter [Ereboglobus sp. PH5-10]